MDPDHPLAVGGAANVSTESTTRSSPFVTSITSTNGRHRTEAFVDSYAAIVAYSLPQISVRE